MPSGVALRRTAACIVALTLGLFARSELASQTPSIADLLDRYRSGAFDAAVKELSTGGDPYTFRTAFIEAAGAWIAREPDVANRRLVTAAFTIEVAHARLAHDSLFLVVVDWATRELRKGPPTPAERAWVLAAVAVAQRGSVSGNLALDNPKNGWKGLDIFINDAFKRFPDDPRLRLANATSRSRAGGSVYIRGDLERLAKDPVVGAEALVQLAYLEVIDGDCREGLRVARQAAERSLEAHTLYLAHVWSAVCHEMQGRPSEAVSAYAAALRAVPHGQSASIALAGLLLRDGQVNAATDLIERSLTERPVGDDPWRLFAYGGYVRWPLLVADARKTIR
jgi:hypothetical protein